MVRVDQVLLYKVYYTLNDNANFETASRAGLLVHFHLSTFAHNVHSKRASTPQAIMTPAGIAQEVYPYLSYAMV